MLQTMCNVVVKDRKTYLTIRYGFGSGFFFNFIKFSTVDMLLLNMQRCSIAAISYMGFLHYYRAALGNHLFNIPRYVHSRSIQSTKYLASGNTLEIIQYCAYSNWINFRFRCGCVPVPVNWIFVVFSPCFAIFKNVVHSLEPCETPSNSVSHRAPNCAQRS